MTGEPTEGFSNGHMDRGHEMEPDARNSMPFGWMLSRSRWASSATAERRFPDSLVGANG